MRLKRLNQAGYNFVELAMAMLIMGAMVSSVTVARKFMAKQVQATSDKAYASQKALQMFEELKAVVGSGEQIAVLDAYSDGNGFNTVLTTDKNVDVAVGTKNPADPLSGNRTTNGNWRYLREVMVNRVANDPNAREVYVKVYLYGGDNNPTQGGPLLSSVGGILRTIVGLDPPTQVMDLYVLDIQNTQAWWGILPSLSTMMQAVITDIGGAYGSGRNPGLQIRPHYIVRNSFGRDSQYIPFINQSKGTDQEGVTWVYLYPGLSLENPEGTESNFYDPSAILQTGSFNVDGGINLYSSAILNSASVTVSTSVADQFNNGLRYPDEMAAYQAVTAAAVLKGVATPDISYRMLIEQMNSSPQSFTNAVIMNLHGEVVPLPPMRNYSDAAKDPGSVDNAAMTNVRVVTHPELIYYPVASSSTVSVNLRVYAYYDGLKDPSSLDSTYQNNKTTGPLVPGISILLPDLFVPAGNIAVTAIVDKWVGASTSIPATYVKEGLAINTNDATDSLTNPTKWNAQTITGTTVIGGVSVPITQTLITLYNTRLRCPLSATGASGNSSGLPVSFRLYGTEYIPCSPEMTALSSNTNPTFTNQWLDAGGANGVKEPKNTARWVITLSGIPVSQTSIANGSVTCHEVDTRIGTAVTTNAAPPNLSKTYFWVGNNNPPPTTEQFQFLGDPRDCPYLDVKVGGEKIAGATVTIQANGYNWWFKNLPNGTDGYSGFGQAPQAQWVNNIMDDVPRYHQMLRNGIMETTSIWTTLNGFSFFYYGLGGEMGFDHDPFQTGIPFQSMKAWNLGGGAGTVSEIRPNNCSVNNCVDIAGTANAGTTQQWYAKPWLGELYPDVMYSCWQTIGNLPTGDNPTAFTMNFYRADFSAISQQNPWTTANDTQDGFNGNSTNRVSQEPGCASFFNGGDASGDNFMHDYASSTDTGSLTSLGMTLYTNFQYTLPGVVNLQRPWQINSTSNQPPEWSTVPYSNTKTTLSIPNIPSPGAGKRIIYNSTVSSSWNGSGLVQVVDSTGTYQGYVMETGTSPSANVGSVDLAKTMLVTSLRAFNDGGQIAVTGAMGHIHQLPLVEIYPVLSGGASVTINPLPQYSTPQTIQLEAAGPLLDSTGVYPQPNVWFSFPSVTPPANYYTQEYPGYNSGVTGTLANSTYSEADTLVYNFKWGTSDPAAGGKLYFINTSPKVQASAGVYNASYAVTNSIPVTGILQNWNVSDPVMFPNGTYWVTVEAYRQGLPLHYATHSLELTINR